MNRLQRIRRISGWLRRLTLLLAVALVGAVAFALGVPGQTLITLGNGQLNQLLGSGAFGGSAAIAVFAPMGLLLALGLYWLQRLFGEYQRGHFSACHFAGDVAALKESMQAGPSLSEVAHDTSKLMLDLEADR